MEMMLTRVIKVVVIVEEKQFHANSFHSKASRHPDVSPLNTAHQCFSHTSHRGPRICCFSFQQLAPLIIITLTKKEQELKGEMSRRNLLPPSHMAEKSPHNGQHELHRGCFWRRKRAQNNGPECNPRFTQLLPFIVFPVCFSTCPCGCLWEIDCHPDQRTSSLIL